MLIVLTYFKQLHKSRITRIGYRSSFATPWKYYVITDLRDTEFVLKLDEDIRRIGEASLLVGDSHGINFLVRDMFKIDKHSRKILDRLL
jgi:hypothetical protein